MPLGRGAVPSLSLNNGVPIPQVGFGVFMIDPSVTASVISSALDAGYRHFDLASFYGNEASVGAALKGSDVPRDELFITTKVWNSDQGYDSTLAAFDTSCAALGFDTVDLYLIHWPAPMLDKYVHTWRALERLYHDGRARAIGVSNFEPVHLLRILEECSVVPAVNQIELHPYLQQRELRALHANHSIVTEGWSPLARGGLLNDPVLVSMAQRHGVTVAQVILRWHVQLGNVVFPKSATRSRIRSNIEVFGFGLSAAEMDQVEALDRNGRTGPHPNEYH